MESAATVEEEKSNLKESMEAYREQMDAVKQYLSTSTYKPGSNAVTKRTIRIQESSKNSLIERSVSTVVSEMHTNIKLSSVLGKT